jgi:hypothetical protein
VRGLVTLSILIAGFLAAGGIAQGQTNKELYDLQDRCGKRAAEIFIRDYGGSPPVYSHGSTKNINTTFIYTYRNHYSQRLNKCFYMLQTRIQFKSGGETGETLTLELLDVNENNQYGLFIGSEGHIPTSCEILQKKCSSQDEWLNLASPYLDE